MITRVDHIDLRVKDFDGTVGLFEKLGLSVLRSMPERNSVEMALPGEHQVVFEIHLAAEEAAEGIHHVAFKCEGEEDDVEILKDRGIAFKNERKLIVQTGRTVSNIEDSNCLIWQLTD